MRIETINEPVRVLAAFSAGQVSPVKFRWNTREMDVFAVNGRWRDRLGDGWAHHFSVEAGDETYYLHFSTVDMQWWLDQVIVE